MIARPACMHNSLAHGALWPMKPAATAAATPAAAASLHLLLCISSASPLAIRESKPSHPAPCVSPPVSAACKAFNGSYAASCSHACPASSRSSLNGKCRERRSGRATCVRSNLRPLGLTTALPCLSPCLLAQRSRMPLCAGHLQLSSRRKDCPRSRRKGCVRQLLFQVPLLPGEASPGP